MAHIVQMSRDMETDNHSLGLKRFTIQLVAMTINNYDIG